jgi:hypothetical protein
MKPFNTAQKMLNQLFGVDPIALIAWKREKSKSNTKKGPGRIHLQGKIKNA